MSNPNLLLVQKYVKVLGAVGLDANSALSGVVIICDNSVETTLTFPTLDVATITSAATYIIMAEGNGNEELALICEDPLNDSFYGLGDANYANIVLSNPRAGDYIVVKGTDVAGSYIVEYALGNWETE